MMCRNPFTRGLAAYPCGRCLPCLFNRRRVWTHRIILESMMHGDNAFVTLTYAENKLPLNAGGLPTLTPEHMQLFLKKLRFNIYPHKVRFYGVGEYGDQTWRPHYHLALFGYPRCSVGRTDYGRYISPRCCRHCELLHDTWDNGRIDSIELSESTAQYVAGYVTKKMTRTDDARLNGRWPEFARMSNRPGIGYHAMHDVASALMQYHADEMIPDVPGALRHGTRMLPLGRYLKHKLRLMIGKDEKTPHAVLQEVAKEMRPLLEAAIKNKEDPSFKNQVIKAGDGKAARAIALSKIRKQRKSL